MITLKIKGSSSKPIPIDYYPAQQEQAPIIIFVHGFKGFKDWGTHRLCAEFFNNKGFSFLKFNFSHNGITEDQTDIFNDLEAFGENTFSRELFDLDEVITFVLSGEAFPAPEKLFLIGHSRGGGVSIIQTAEDPRISKLVTWASISRFNTLWKPEQEEDWKREGVIYTTNARTKQEMPLNLALLEDFEHNSERLNISNAASAIRQPWLIIHGDSDTAVPVEQAQELHRQNNKSFLRVVNGGDHVFGARHPWTEKILPPVLEEVCEETVNFFSAE
ncbi:alpha/beta hydrolase family protein [Desertivirga brevis]|uniref:alpha/beta hydrolase family protein n=1 Tax=Desertivirga brevis TaxID=2810310 RepID=UPI001A964855|nr:prolyl oligopeptidase family serine peptidase [Pedobacter sp. SYSU D00873]